MTKFQLFCFTGHQISFTRSTTKSDLKNGNTIYSKKVSLALSPGYAGPRFLNSSVCHLRISTKESDVKPTIENLTGFELQQKLKEILRLKDPFAAMLELDEQYNAGIFTNIYLGIQFNYIWYNQSLKHGN